VVCQRPRSHADWARRLGGFLEGPRQCLDVAASFWTRCRYFCCNQVAGMWVFAAKPSAIAGLRTRCGGHRGDRDTLAHWQAFRHPLGPEMLTSRLRQNERFQQVGRLSESLAVGRSPPHGKFDQSSARPVGAQRQLLQADGQLHRRKPRSCEVSNSAPKSWSHNRYRRFPALTLTGEGNHAGLIARCGAYYEMTRT
jgi:hypothetical protein